MRVDSFSDRPIQKANIISEDASTINSQQETATSKVDSLVTEQRLNDLIDRGNKVLLRMDTHLQWSVHKSSHQMIVKVVDTKTNETLREIPPEKYLDLVQNLCEQVGLFLDERK
ncbi:flagellar protein FlaG [Paenibacillus sp. FSL W8-0187]|uniref:flagellar protein FlaG n=1 Tax=Paenibacillus TaxID=44249 RepID=UPI0030D7FDD4